MYEYLVENPKVGIIFAIVGVLVVLFLFVKAMQTIGMEKARAYVYKLFIKAENEFEYGDNSSKFEYVISMAKSAIPMPFSLFVTESLLRDVVQTWFDVCKDLLDDGKFNGTGKGGDTNE